MDKAVINILIELANKNNKSVEELTAVLMSLLESQINQGKSIDKLSEKIKTISLDIPDTKDVDYKELFKGEDGQTPSEEYLVSLIKPLIPGAPSEKELLAIIKPLIPEKITEKELIKIIKPLIPEPKHGKDGRTPIKGVDYFSEKDIGLIVRDVTGLIPKQKTTEQIAREINNLEGDNRVSYNSLKDTPDLSKLKGEDRLGFGALNNLLDVGIITPTNGQVLVYNETTKKWENQDISSGGSSVLVNSTNVSNPNFIDSSDIEFDLTNDDIEALVKDDAITNVKLANMPGHTVKVRVGGSAGDPTDLTLGSHDVLARNGGNIVSVSAGTNTILRRLTGNTLGFGKVVNNLVETNTLGLDKLVQIGTPRVLGNLGSAVGNVQQVGMGELLDALDVKNSLTETRIGAVSAQTPYNIMNATGFSTLGTVTLLANTTYYQRIVVPETFIDVPQIAVHITATTANRASLTMYQVSDEGVPSVLFRNLTFAPSVGTNIITLTGGNNIIPKGVYYIGLNFVQDTTIRSVEDSQPIGITETFGVDLIKQFAIPGVSWSAPPNPINPATLTNIFTNPPAVGFRIKLT